MDRRSFLSSTLVAAVARQSAFCGIIDCRVAPKRGRVWVDGREIEKVFYLDTECGFVRTYDLQGSNAPLSLQDGNLHSVRAGANAPDGEFSNSQSRCGWTVDGLLYQTLHGKVTVELA